MVPLVFRYQPQDLSLLDLLESLENMDASRDEKWFFLEKVINKPLCLLARNQLVGS